MRRARELPRDCKGDSETARATRCASVTTTSSWLPPPQTARTLYVLQHSRED